MKFNNSSSQSLVLFLLCVLISAAYIISPAQIYGQSSSSVDKTVELKAVAGLKYDKVRFTVNPGSTVRITLENVDEMMHNMLIVKPETRIKVVKSAEAMGKQGMEHDFIPESPNVLESIPMLGPGDKASMVFKVPEKEAIYPYVCTYPAHGLVMYGVIYATNSPDELPPLDEDANIPEPVRNQIAASMAMHPYSREMPTIARLFMPESSPAAIAVGMEKEQSYNWDAGYSFLRYAWDGGFIDATKQWDAKAHEVAEIKGDIYYRNTTGFPFRVGRRDSVPEPEFQGYRMVEGYARFKYTMGDITVRELIQPAATTPGFKIEYTLENVDQPIWYALNNSDDIQLEVSKGKIKEDMLRLTPEQAKEFAITVISDE